MIDPSNLYLPNSDPQRLALHNEVHTRPSATFQLPALIVYVAVMNSKISIADECQHLRQLKGHEDLNLEQLKGNFLQLQCDHFKIIWERHTEFTRYTIIQPLPQHAHWGSQLPELASHVATGVEWLKGIPGTTITAIQLAMFNEGMEDPDAIFKAKQWLGEGTVVGGKLGRTTGDQSHSHLITNMRIGVDGFVRMLVLTSPETSENRAGRVAQRLLELETYRMMSLLSLPIAKQLSSKLFEAETQLVEITARIEANTDSDEALLNLLARLAAQVESATAEHSYRFSAARAYDAIAKERILELREKPLSGIQTLGVFLQRRLAPAIATVNATSDRLEGLAERVARASALLRTRVEIATETHNQELLEKLTRGQALQLRLQTTVEGLSVAAITYYVVSLLFYLGKAIKASGIDLNPEMLAGLSTPVVLFLSWRMIRKIHRGFRNL